MHSLKPLVGLGIHAYVLMTNHIHLLSSPLYADSIGKRCNRWDGGMFDIFSLEQATKHRRAPGYVKTVNNW